MPSSVSGRVGAAPWRSWFLAVALVASLVVAVDGQRAVAATSSFTPITPVRVMDSRLGLGAGIFRQESMVTLSLAAIAPPGATAVMLNVTATEATSGSYVTVWPAGSSRPPTSNLNVRAGVTRPNAVAVGLGAGSAISIYNNQGNVHLIVDVMGWFSAGFNGVVPDRLADTRIGLSGTRLGPGGTLTVAVAGRSGVPADAVAVAVNVTVTGPTMGSFLTVWPTGAPRPTTSNLNYVAGDTVANLAIVSVGLNRTISLFNNQGNVDVIVDVMGWFDAAGGINPMTPVRRLDTRDGTCGFRLGQGETRTLDIATTANGTVNAAALNVTAVSPTVGTFLTVWPTGAPRPNTSNVNIAAGQAPTPNFVVVGLGAGGQVDIFNASGTVEVVVDLFGTFNGPTPSGELTPCPTSVPPPPTPPELVPVNPYATLHRTVGTDQVAVYVCRIPTNTTDPFYRAVGTGLVIAPTDVAIFSNELVSPYFLETSLGRYHPVFTAVGYIDLATSDGPTECLDKAQFATTSNFSNVLAVDTSRYSGGFAGPGWISSDPAENGNHLVLPPASSDRGAYVGGGGSVAALVAHEIGHTVHWPHSHRTADEYDNPLDIMSSWIGTDCTAVGGTCRPKNTIAYNRYLAGWIDDADVRIHRSGTTVTSLAAPAQAGTQLLLALSPTEPNVFLTLEARPRTGYDSALGKAGVAVHVVDQRLASCRLPLLPVCVSTSRYQGQAAGGANQYVHVVAPGASLTVSGVTVTVVGVSGSGYMVAVSGAFDAGSFVRVAGVATVGAASTEPPAFRELERQLAAVGIDHVDPGSAVTGDGF